MREGYDNSIPTSDECCYAAAIKARTALFSDLGMQYASPSTMTWDLGLHSDRTAGNSPVPVARGSEEQATDGYGSRALSTSASSHRGHYLQPGTIVAASELAELRL